MTFDPTIFTELAHSKMREWACQSDGEIFHTHSSLLWPVIYQNQKAMLKIVDPQGDESNAPNILRYYNGVGAIKILEHEGHIQLLERAISTQPDHDLDLMVRKDLADWGGLANHAHQINRANRTDQATQIICDTIERLHGRHNSANAKDLPNHLDAIESRRDHMLGYMQEGRVPVSSLPLFQYAADLSKDLMEETKESFCLLHGDVHHGNILYDDDRGWLAIDPKGFWGPKIYEYAHIMCNPYEYQGIVATPSHMQRQSAIIHDKTGLDTALLLQFTFMHSMQCAAWCLSKKHQDYWMACALTAARCGGLNLPDCPASFSPPSLLLSSSSSKAKNISLKKPTS